jgi:dihydrodipicolinate reductase
VRERERERERESEREREREEEEEEEKRPQMHAVRVGGMHPGASVYGLATCDL